MYLIYQNNDLSWTLRLNANGFRVQHIFKSYIEALHAVELLRLKLNKYDKKGQVFKLKAI